MEVPRAAVGKREREPQTPPSRARWRAERSEGTPIALQSPVGLARGASNDFHWDLGGHFSHNAPTGAARRAIDRPLGRFRKYPLAEGDPKGALAGVRKPLGS